MPDPTESTLSAALAHERNGRFREALALYDGHLAVHPRNTVALHRSGCALLAAGDAVGAVHRLRAALALDAGLAPAWADLGRALAAIGRVEAAINAYAEASKRAPGDAARSEEHTSELQSRPHLVCRLLLEKKKNNNIPLFFYKKNKKNNNLK